MIAFSTHPDVRREISVSNNEPALSFTELNNSAMSPLFLATVEATEEAILNSLFMAESMQGADSRTEEALPVNEIMGILKKYGVVD